MHHQKKNTTSLTITTKKATISYRRSTASILVIRLALIAWLILELAQMVK